jgi:adenylosuccinate lyase
MIKRYTHPIMEEIWSEQNKFDTWLNVELAVLRTHEKLTPNVPEGCADAIQAACDGHLDVSRITEIESEVQHDVIAFTTHVSELAGEPARYFHLGLTSSDVLDTALALTIKRAGDVLNNGLCRFLDVLKRKVVQYAHLPIIGRTHGVHAEPTTLGLKLALCWDEIKRGKERLAIAIKGAAVGKISGAVGNYSQISPEIEISVGKRLNIPMASISNQIVTRDRHAAVLCAMAVLAGSFERLTTEVRLLQHTEIGELAEPFNTGQKGSSAMPHKRNPIVCERISGLSRLMRGYAQTAMENQVLWHERDISHSSAERVIFPDAFCLLDYMIDQCAQLIYGLVVNEDNIENNINLSNDIYQSQSILMHLLKKGFSREDAYRIVQKAAFAALESNESLIKTINDILPLSDDEVLEIFNLDRFICHVDEILARVFRD